MKTLFTLLLSIVTLLGYSQWKWSNPSPIGYDLNDVSFVNQTIGYIVGEKGTVLKTTDGGQTWSYLQTGSFRNYGIVTFLDETTGYISSGDYLMKTTDGGITWNDVYYAADYYITDLFFLDENRGFLSSGGVLLRTTDGGANWTSTLILGNKTINSIWFSSDSVGYAACSLGTVMKTEDGGITWDAQINPNMLEMKDVFFVDDNTGFVAGEQGFSMRTTDGGTSWTTTGSNYNLKELYFINGLTGYAISGSSFVRTTNAGTSWVTVGMDDIRSFYFVSENTVFGVGEEGRLFKSNNSGSSYQNYNPSVTYSKINDIHFPDMNTGYAVTEDGEIIKTTDAGSHWTKISSGQFMPIKSVWFTSANTGYFISNTSLYKTIDGGISWNETNLNYIFSEIMFVNENTGFLRNEYSSIYRTDDAGNTWSVIYEGDWPRAMHFLTPDTGYIALDASVLKTTDGGVNWTEFNDFEPSNIFKSMFFVNPNVGYVGSFMFGKLYKTSDGGLSWIDLSDPSRIFAVMDLFFTSENTGYMMSDGLHQTNDGGNTWVKLNYISSSTSKLWFTDSQTGYAAGYNGTILKTTNGGAVPVLSPDKPASQFTIYPNPATDEFTLTSNSVTGPITLTIYNSNGLCISLDKYNSSTIKIKTANLPSGLYFLRINSEKGTEVNKLVVL